MFLVFFILNHFCALLLLACNFQSVLLVDSNCTDILVCLCMTFLCFPLIDAGDVVSESENYISL